MLNCSITDRVHQAFERNKYIIAVLLVVLLPAAKVQHERALTLTTHNNKRSQNKNN